MQKNNESTQHEKHITEENTQENNQKQQDSCSQEELKTIEFFLLSSERYLFS